MIEIKKIGADDVEQLKQISIKTFSDTFAKDNDPSDLNEYLTTAYSEDKLSKELTTAESEFYFIYTDDHLAGYLKLNVGEAQTESIANNSMEIERIYVDTQFKRLGLGKKLYEKAVSRANELKKEVLWLGVWEKNTPALAFYEKMGFVQAGQHSFFMGTDEQIDLIMKKTL
ncbi:GNAT family N-acetyltransferase [Enterococcus wangshanyuanii]|uniref:Spermidine/spermine N(1)-acetyltransferase n=1 Tax=Enterococcus wangshanyuanii TaxID=2005703 RepID=A0ABQ1P5D8_9ENTE|nr:GNAT family N-acetyltransferase [Enterococcus wangshanyuanii]GGC91169.1 spermidine/spermine N(1)-acetyltransferase [Enterococcus wangshanyuanii]